jgi:hypothetical protein
MLTWQRWTLAAITTIVGALYLHQLGPRPVMRAFDALPITVPFWYMLSAFPVLGLLLAELLELGRVRRWRAAGELAGAIAVMVLLSHGRLELAIPLSGHSLLFTYAMLRRARPPHAEEPRRPVELSLCAALLVVVSGVKLLWWGDPVTWGVGLGAGLALHLVGRWAAGGRDNGRR